jgi:hypothetical protein
MTNSCSKRADMRPTLRQRLAMRRLARDRRRVFDFWLKVFAVSFGMGAVEMVRVSAIGENGSAPMGYQKAKWRSAPSLFHSPTQKFALYSRARARSLQPMPRKPQALTGQF